MVIAFTSRSAHRATLSWFRVIMLLSVFVIPSLGQVIPEPTQNPANASNATVDTGTADPSSTNGTTVSSNTTTTPPNVTGSTDPTPVGNATGPTEGTPSGNATNTNGTAVEDDDASTGSNNNTTETDATSTNTTDGPDTTGSTTSNETGTGGTNETATGEKNETSTGGSNPSNIFMRNETEGVVEDDSGQTLAPKNDTQLEVPGSNASGSSAPASDALGVNGFRIAITSSLTGFALAIFGSLFL